MEGMWRHAQFGAPQVASIYFIKRPGNNLKTDLSVRERKQMTLARQLRDAWYSPVTGRLSFATEVVLLSARYVFCYGVRGGEQHLLTGLRSSK